MSNTASDMGRRGARLVTVVVVLMRLVVGMTFAFSGFSKAVDPWGTFYKVTDYLMALHWDQFAGLALFGAFALPAFELMLGVGVMVGAYRRGAPVAALLMMVAMLPLTLWLALTGAVPDCGCFGDALVLGNWATFWKNVLLTLGAVFLLVFGRSVKGLYGPAVQWMVMAVTFAAAMAVALYGYFTQPLIDFRPFKTGVKLVSAQPTTNENDYLFVYEKDGVQREFGIDSVPDEEDGWIFVARKEVGARVSVPRRGERAIAVTDQGTDAADDLLSHDRLLLFLFPDLPQVSIATTFTLNELTDKAHAQGVQVAGITSATDGQIAEWNDISMADYPMLVADDTDIKMMARGNPAVVYVSEGKITWKRTLDSLTAARLHDSALTIAGLGDDMQADKTLRQMAVAYALALLAILVVNRTHLILILLLRRKPGTGSAKRSDQAEQQD